MHYEIKHWAWTVPKEDGSTSQVLGSAFQTFPFYTTELGRPATKAKSECHGHGSVGHISPTHAKVTST